MEEAGGIAALGIDWKILVAQLVNFLIIYFLLAKFAFKPLIKMLEERRKKVENSIKTADDIAKEKEDLDITVRKTMSDAKSEAQKIITKAQASMKEEASKARAQAESASAKMLADTKTQIDTMKKETKSELAREIGMLVVKATERIVDQDLPEESKKKVDEKIIRNIKNNV